MVLSKVHSSHPPLPCLFRIQTLKHRTKEQAMSVSQSILQNSQEQVISSVQSAKAGNDITSNYSQAVLQNPCGEFQQFSS